jgi:RNA-binding protein
MLLSFSTYICRLVVIAANAPKSLYIHSAKFIYCMTNLVALGKPEKLSKSGMLLVRIQPNNLPKIGEKVVTRKMEHVGVVYDIIGPIISPYVLIKPEKVVYEDLYVVRGYGGSRKGSGKGSRKGSRKKGD